MEESTANTRDAAASTGSSSRCHWEAVSSMQARV